MAITAAQLRAARGLLGWTQDRLAAVSGVERAVITAFEDETVVPGKPLRDALERALTDNGAMFLPDSTRGVGVRFKFNRRETRAIGRWEEEGGRAGDDDIP